ncbi:MAG TPA: hypothetical protein VMT05_04685 [Terriglobales bacterium]|nr:hypothetical protein [Terriglobales bacterium]
MARFKIFQRRDLAEYAGYLKLAKYTPAVPLDGLLPGVDNLRHDVFLSPRFTQLARQHLWRLIVQYGDVQELTGENEAGSRPAWAVKPVRKRNAAEPGDFRRALTELYTVALSRAKGEGNITLDLLAHVAVLKFLKSELLGQFNQVLDRVRARVNQEKNSQPARTHALQERFARLQMNKKMVLRRVGEELFRLQRDIEKESLARMRRSLFGDENAGVHEIFINRLLFTEEGRDDYLNAEHYVMLGNYERDPDRFFAILEIARLFLKSLQLEDLSDECDIRGALSVPENAQELAAGGTPDEADPKGRAQKAVLEAWRQTLEEHGMMQHVIAAYEVVPILPEYSPPINAQQLKNALIQRAERLRVEELLAEQGKLSVEAMHDAIKRVLGCRGSERAKVAGRFLVDFIRYHRDVRKLEALTAAMERVNVITNPKVRELSAINNTLYEFLLPEEQKPAEDKVLDHVVLKADLRDSTHLTRTLYERGLNPASYFSLNFYEPVNRLLPLFGAEKVFIEGDAVILAILERPGEAQFAVARCCALAREIIGVVHAYNEKSRQAGLPTLELGIGIAYQDSAPLYLMDGATRVMISPALNESDRLSSCNRVARRCLAKNPTPFNVFAFQSGEGGSNGDDPEEFLVRYNIGGVHLDPSAFEKLRQEISLRTDNLQLPMIWGREPIRLYSGVVPLPSGGFQKLVVREGRAALVDPHTFGFKRWTDLRYYEACTSADIYEHLEKIKTAAAAPALVR